jgi:hypothetical protein
MTSIVIRRVFTVSLAFDRLTLADLPSRTTCFTRGSIASSLRRRHTFACVSAFVARDRPAASESIGPAWALRAYSSRPARSRLLTRSGASLEVSRPLQHTSAASRAISEGGRPPDLSRSGVLRSPYRPRSRATDLTIGKRFAPAVFRFTSEIVAASLGPVDALGLSSAVSHHLATSLATRGMTNRTVSTRFPIVFGPSRGCGR